MLRKGLLIITLLDFLFILCHLYILNPDHSMGIIVVFALPFLVALNIVLWLLTLLIQRFVFKNPKSVLPKVLLYNALISPAIYFVSFLGWDSFNLLMEYKTYSFTVNGKNYELIYNLQKGKFTNNENFGIYERGDNWSNGVMGGKYRSNDDTIFLFEDTSFHHNEITEFDTFKMIMVDKQLIGCPLKKDGIDVK